MVSDEIRIVPCREADIPALMSFIDTRWRAGHILSRDETLLRWQFDPMLIAGTAFHGPTVMLAWHGDTIVGMLGLTGFDLNAEGVSIPGAWLSHWLAVPEYRHLNVAARLLLSVRDLGLGALGAIGANELAAKALVSLGWELIPDLPRWIGVFDRRETRDLLVASAAGLGSEEIDRLCRCHLVADGVLTRSSEERIEVVAWAPRMAGEWDRCWHEQLARILVGTARDSAYLQRRYVEHPRFRYELRLARRPGDRVVCGLTVFRVEQVRDRPEHVLRVVEFLASPEAECALALSVAQAARAEGVAFADFYCSSAQAAAGLERIGFNCALAEPERSAFPCRLQPLESGHFTMTALLQLPPGLHGTLSRQVESGRVYVTKSDGDQDRPN